MELAVTLLYLLLSIFNYELVNSPNRTVLLLLWIITSVDIVLIALSYKYPSLVYYLLIIDQIR